MTILSLVGESVFHGLNDLVDRYGGEERSPLRTLGLIVNNAALISMGARTIYDIATHNMKTNPINPLEGTALVCGMLASFLIASATDPDQPSATIGNRPQPLQSFEPS